MPQLAAGTDFVQLPADSSGKKAAFYPAAVSGGTLYLPASILVDASGNLIDASNALPTSGGIGLEVTGSVAATVDLLPIAATDVSAFKWVSVYLSGNAFTNGGVVTFEASEDNASWVACQLGKVDTAVLATTATSFGIYAGPLNAKYFRVRVTTGATAKTVAARAEFSYRPTTAPAAAVTATQGPAGSEPWPVNIGSVGEVALDSLTISGTGLLTAAQLYASDGSGNVGKLGEVSNALKVYLNGSGLSASGPLMTQLSDGTGTIAPSRPLAVQLSDGASSYVAASDATLTGGTTKAINRGGAKGATTAADVTSTAEGADHQALDVQIMHGGAAKDPTAIRALTSADSVTVANASGGSAVNVQDGGNVLSVDDAGSTLSVDDGGASLTVDGTVAHSEAKAEDAAAASGDLGVPMLAVRNDSAVSKTSTDGDYSMLATDAAGRLGIADLGGSISVDDNAGSLTVDNGGTFAVQDSEKVADNAGFTDGTTKVQPAGFIFDEVAGTALTENDAGAARMDSKRSQVITLEDATTRGRRATIDASGRLSVDASGVAVPVTDNAGSLTVDSPGIPTALGQGTMSQSMRVVLPSDQASVPVAATLGAETTKVIGTVNQGTSPWVTGGNAASGASDSGNPMKIGGRFNTTLPTVTDAQRVDIQTDARGRLIVIDDDGRRVTYRGRASTFKTLGRAGTAGQKIFAIHNATGSSVLVDVDQISVDIMQTVAKAVEPPAIRLWKFTAVPTNGNAITKVPEDSNLTSNASVTLWQDSSADNTGSSTTLTVTLPAATVVDTTWAARALTLVGYEQFDQEVFLQGNAITLRALEGLCVFLDYTVATANPTTDKWLVTARWLEYTAA